MGGEFALDDYSYYIENFPSVVIADPVHSINEAATVAQSTWESVYGAIPHHSDNALCQIEVFYDPANDCWYTVGHYLQQSPPVAGGEPYMIIQSDGKVLAVWHTQ